LKLNFHAQDRAAKFSVFAVDSLAQSVPVLMPGSILELHGNALEKK
jgi:hypothetical protein